MLSCSIRFSAPSFWMGGGLEIRCVGRVYGADGALRLHGTIRTVICLHYMYRDNLNYKCIKINNTATFYTVLAVVYIIFFKFCQVSLFGSNARLSPYCQPPPFDAKTSIVSST